MENIWDILAIIVATVALIFSIITYKITLKREKRKEYYEDFFKEFLIKSIPEAINKIELKEGIFIDNSDFSNTVSILFIEKIRPLKYLEKKLYERVLDQMTDIEDLFVANHEKRMSRELFNKEIKTIENEVAILYSKTKR